VPDDPTEKEKTDKPAEPKAAEPKADEPVAEAKLTADEPAAADAFRPEEIAKRIERLGGETEEQRLAREEELKLQARRAEKKKTGKKAKKGLEAAASKRLARIAEGKPVKRPVAVAAEADPLIERTAKISAWAQKNQRFMSYALAAGLLALFGVGLFLYLQQRREMNASTLLTQAVADARGRVGDPEKDPKDQLKDPRPVFKTDDDRRAAALAKYREVESTYPGTGAAYLARLGEAGILLDQGDAEGARKAYEDVKSSPLGQVDGEVKGRALEGTGFSDELLAMKNPADKDRDLELALTAFKALSDVDSMGMKLLGKYHQARVLEEQGKRDEAIKLLEEVHEATAGKLGEPPKPDDDRAAYFYLRDVADDRLRLLDRNAVPSKAMQRLYDQLQMQRGGGGGMPPGMPPMPPGR
jgi:hypothetical protein